MKIKVFFAMLFSLLLFTNAKGHEHGLGFHAMPRKLMLEQKVESAENKKLAEASSGQSHKGEEETLEVTMQEGSNSTRVFAMDYTPVKRRRRPVHNKFSPAAINSP